MLQLNSIFRQQSQRDTRWHPKQAKDQDLQSNVLQELRTEPCLTFLITKPS